MGVCGAGHRLLARRAAVKLVRPELLGANNEEEARLVLKRFEREAQATAALSSPHTIQVFDFGSTDDGTFFYVMELLMGRDLESLVREFGPVPAARAGFLLRQVCHSLADAHARGLVHRDIKPANIYVCRVGLEYDFVKVLDFGLVKLNSQASREGIQTLMTADQRTTGTPAYMAPEIILGEASVDRRADVYALGCVAYYALTGQLVFEADTPMKMLLQHVQAEPIPPSQRTELPIPRELDELVLSCLQKDPNKRPQNAEVLLDMAVGCKTGDCWNQDLAKGWWSKHLPEFTASVAWRLRAFRSQVTGGWFVLPSKVNPVAAFRLVEACPLTTFSRMPPFFSIVRIDPILSSSQVRRTRWAPCTFARDLQRQAQNFSGITLPSILRHDNVANVSSRALEIFIE
jgi:serine/threonine-protein kinase